MTEYACSCGRPFGNGSSFATTNGQPAALWALLEHQSATGHPPKGSQRA